LSILKYLHEHHCPWDSMTLGEAHTCNQIECLNYAVEQRCPGWKRYLPEGHPDYDPSDFDSSDSSDSDDEDE
jgi:membrane-associated PAP2 superfamily phosphatase